MGQRNNPRSIPSMLEYRTIQLRDRYETPLLSANTDNLSSRFAGSSQEESGIHVRDGRQDRERENERSNDAYSGSPSPRLPPSLAGCGLHSFSQMAQFLPNICAKNPKRHPSLHPTSQAGVNSMPLDDIERTGFEPTLSILRKALPQTEAYLCRAPLINMASRPSVPNSEFFLNQQLGANSVAGFDNTSGFREIQKAETNSMPKSEIQLRKDKLPPIPTSLCTVHASGRSCVHKKNSKKDTNQTKNSDETVKKSGKNKISKNRVDRTTVTKACVQGKKNESRDSRKKQRVKNVSKGTPEEPASSYKTRKRRFPSSNTDSINHEDVEEETYTSSYSPSSTTHFNASQDGSTLRIDRNFKRTNHILDDSLDDEELLYFHNLTTLHPPQTILPPIISTQLPSVQTKLTESLVGQSEDLDNLGWAKDGFLEDSALRRAILLRNQALYSTDGESPKSKRVSEAQHVGDLDTATKAAVVATEAALIRSGEDHSQAAGSTHESQANGVKTGAKFEQNVKPQQIRSVTWQDVSSHLGPKKEKNKDAHEKQVKRKEKPSRTTQKSTSGLAAEALRYLQQKRGRHRNHSNCKSTLPEEQIPIEVRVQHLPTMTLLDSHLSAPGGSQTSKSLNELLGKASAVPTQAPQTGALTFASSYPKFMKMSLPSHKALFPPLDHSGKEENFEGCIDGMKVTNDCKRSNPLKRRGKSAKRQAEIQ